MKPTTSLWIALVVVSINALVFIQDLHAWLQTTATHPVAFPVWQAITLAGASVYLLTAGIIYDRSRRGGKG